MRLGIRHVCLVIGIFTLWNTLVPNSAKAQESDPWRIYSPAPDTLIGEGELFVVVSLEKTERLDPASVTFYLDGNDVTRLAKVSDTSIRLLYTRTLGGGHHQIFITARNQEGSSLPKLGWQFSVEGPVTAMVRTPKRRFDFYGTTAIDTRTSDFTGRRDLRQEPLHTYVFQVDAEGHYGAFTFPVRVYATTDEGSGAQPRNRFLLGARSKHFSMFFGDNSPIYNPLMLNGARVRGVSGEVNFGPLHFAGTHGLLRRGIAPDVFQPGTFERRLTAFRLGLGSRRSVLWNVNVVRGRDAINSIPIDIGVAGVKPQDNLVGGTDLSLRLFKGQLNLEGGASVSLKTEDTSRGPATKAEIDSLFDANLPFDPASYDWLITLNSSTVPLRADELSSLAWYVKGRASVYGNTLTAAFQNVGEAYASFGNPFLLSDRRSFSVTDRFRVLGNRLSGTLRFRHYGTPPRGDLSLATLTANMYGGQLVLSPWRGPTWLYVGYRLHDRGTTADGTGDQVSDTRVTTYSLGGYHLARTGEFQHGLSISFTRAEREDRVRPSLDNTTQTITAGLNEQLPFPLYFNIQVNRLTVRSGSLGTWQRLTTFSGRAGYQLDVPLINVSLGLQNTHTAETLLLPNSDRFGLFFRGTYRVRHNMDLELQAGYNKYREPVLHDNRYTERYIILRHRYTF